MPLCPRDGLFMDSHLHPRSPNRDTEGGNLGRQRSSERYIELDAAEVKPWAFLDATETIPTASVNWIYPMMTRGKC